MATIMRQSSTPMSVRATNHARASRQSSKREKKLGRQPGASTSTMMLATAKELARFRAASERACADRLAADLPRWAAGRSLPRAKSAARCSRKAKDVRHGRGKQAGTSRAPRQLMQWRAARRRPPRSTRRTGPAPARRQSPSTPTGRRGRQRQPFPPATTRFSWQPPTPGPAFDRAAQHRGAHHTTGCLFADRAASVATRACRRRPPAGPPGRGRSRTG